MFSLPSLEPEIIPIIKVTGLVGDGGLIRYGLPSGRVPSGTHVGCR